MTKTYSEKLKDPRWQKKRLEILNRDSFKCKFCRDTEETLHVHHITYGKGKDPWDYPGGNFLTLCETCHESLEGMKNEILSSLDSLYQVKSLVTLSRILKNHDSHIDNAVSGLIRLYEKEKELETGDVSDKYDHTAEMKECGQECVSDIFRCLFSAESKVKGSA